MCSLSKEGATQQAFCHRYLDGKRHQYLVYVAKKIIVINFCPLEQCKIKNFASHCQTFGGKSNKKLEKPFVIIKFVTQ